MPTVPVDANRQLNVIGERPLSGIAFSESKYRNCCNLVTRQRDVGFSG
jgi:hypothetical protein